TQRNVKSGCMNRAIAQIARFSLPVKIGTETEMTPLAGPDREAVVCAENSLLVPAGMDDVQWWRCQRAAGGRRVSRSFLARRSRFLMRPALTALVALLHFCQPSSGHERIGTNQVVALRPGPVPPARANPAGGERVVPSYRPTPEALPSMEVPA